MTKMLLQTKPKRHLYNLFWHKPPHQWELFLKRYPDQVCDEVAVTPYLEETMYEVHRINCLVNALGYISEEPTRDAWHLAAGVYNVHPLKNLRIPFQGLWGWDCDDQALTKRALIKKVLGIPLGALQPTLCMRDGLAHMVILLATEVGEYVLENDINDVPPWDKTNLKRLFRWQGRRWNWCV